MMAAGARLPSFPRRAARRFIAAFSPSPVAVAPSARRPSTTERTSLRSLG